MNAFLRWLSLGTSVCDSTVSQRVLDVTEDYFRAIMPLRVAKVQLLGQTMFVPLETNLYKKTTSTSTDTIAWTHRLMELFGCDFERAYATGLWDATERVMIVDDGYHYATQEEPDLENASPATVARARQFCKLWRDSYARYDFTERELQPQADAIITNRSDVTICVYSADCVMALVTDRKHHAVGVIHSMWRNLVGAGLTNGRKDWSIIQETVRQMMEYYGSNPCDIEVVLFPCASPENYQVGADVAKKFRNRDLDKAVSERDGRYYLDLNLAAAELFTRSGILRENITTIPFSTDDPEFASLRNSKKGRSSANPMILSDDDVCLSNEKRQPVTLGNENWQNVLIVKTNAI